MPRRSSGCSGSGEASGAGSGVGVARGAGGAAGCARVAPEGGAAAGGWPPRGAPAAAAGAQRQAPGRRRASGRSGAAGGETAEGRGDVTVLRSAGGGPGRRDARRAPQLRSDSSAGVHEAVTRGAAARDDDKLIGRHVARPAAAARTPARARAGGAVPPCGKAHASGVIAAERAHSAQSADQNATRRSWKRSPPASRDPGMCS